MAATGVSRQCSERLLLGNGTVAIKTCHDMAALRRGNCSSSRIHLAFPQCQRAPRAVLSPAIHAAIQPVRSTSASESSASSLGRDIVPSTFRCFSSARLPNPGPGDDFYAWERQAAGAGARAYITALLQCAGVEMSDNKSPADQLSEFQRRGVYLARLVECPLQGGDDAEGLPSRYGPIFLKRVQYSYKPRHIALLEPAAPGLAEQLRAAGFGERLVADGQAIRIPGGGRRQEPSREYVLFSSVTQVTEARRGPA